MPNKSDNSSNSNKQLTDLLSEAISTIPSDKQQEIISHPDTPAALAKLKAALGLGTQDAMSPAEQLVAKQAGIATISHPEYDSESESTSRQDELSNIVSKSTEAESKPATKPAGMDDMLKGILQLATHGMKTKLKELTDAISDAQSIKK